MQQQTTGGWWGIFPPSQPIRYWPCQQHWPFQYTYTITTNYQPEPEEETIPAMRAEDV